MPYISLKQKIKEQLCEFVLEDVFDDVLLLLLSVLPLLVTTGLHLKHL